MDSAGKAIQPSAVDVNTINDWKTIEQVSTTFGVPAAEILTAFNLPADTPVHTALKDLESDTFDITALRSRLQNPQKP